MGEALQTNDRFLGTTLEDKYEILERIGVGAMGTVYKARHRLMDRLVAIKVIRQELVDSGDKSFLRRFEREARAASLIDHPNAVGVHDFGMADGIPFLVMQFVEGRTLKSLLEEEGTLAPERVLVIMSQVGAALSAAHDVSVVHRDLKPDNILLSERVCALEETLHGAEPRDWAEVLDFGVAKFLDVDSGEFAQHTLSGNIIGTPQYLSPEQAGSKEVDPRSDIYSMGILIYEMLCGALPFDSKTVTGMLIDHVSTKPLPLRGRVPAVEISRALESVVLKSLEKDPKRRQQSAEELIGELKAVIASPIESAPYIRKPWVAVLGMLSVLIVLGLAAYFFVSGKKKEPRVETVAEIIEVSVPEEAVPEELIALTVPLAEPLEEDVLRAELEAENRLEAERLFEKAKQEAEAGAGGSESAVFALRQALAKHPELETAHVLLAELFFKQGEYKGAVSELVAALRLNKNNQVALSLLGRALLKQGKAAKAEKVFLSAETLDPTASELYFFLGEAYVKQRKYEKAITAYRKELAVDPGSVRSYRALGKIYLRLGRNKEAVAALVNVVRRAPKLGEAYILLGSAYNALGRFYEAVSISEEAVLLRPGSAAAQNNLGLSYQAVGRIDEAILAFRKASQLAPKNDQYRVNLVSLEERNAARSSAPKKEGFWSFFGDS